MIIKIYILVTALLISAFTFAVDDLDRFGKCHKLFTGTNVAPNHALLLKIKNGSMSGENACKELLKSAYLFSGSLNDTNNEEGKKILHTFNVLHNSFFSHIAKKSNWDKSKEKWVYDYNERSYYLLMSLFLSKSDGSSNYPFSKIFVDPDTYKAVRKTDAVNGFRISRLEPAGTGIYDIIYPYPLCGGNWNQWGTQCNGFPFTYQLLDPRVLADAKVDVSSGFMVQTGNSSRVSDGGAEINVSSLGIVNSHDALFTTHNWNMGLDETSPVGQLTGIVAREAKTVPHTHQRKLNDSDGYYRNHIGPALKQPYPDAVDNMYDNLGAGILFPPSFQEGLGLDDEQIAAQNGVNKVPREWVQDIVKDFLCREIPVIRQSDAIAHTTATVNSLAPFRNGVSCMRCHATIDSLSYIARNYQYVRTAPLNVGNLWINKFYHPTRAPSSGLAVTPDKEFAFRPADGDFRYRDYMGNYHDVALTSNAQDPKASFRQLAQYLSSMDDPYICITSKYFRHFTGISPVFFDAGDVDAPVLNARDVAIRDYLVLLGKDLKKNGDLKKVIMDIVSSNIFIDPTASNIKN